MPAAVLAAQLQARTKFPPYAFPGPQRRRTSLNSPAADRDPSPAQRSPLREELAEVSPTPSSISTTPQGPLVATCEHGAPFPGSRVHNQRAVPCMRSPLQAWCQGKVRSSHLPKPVGGRAHPLSPGASSSILHGSRPGAHPQPRAWSCSPNRLLGLPPAPSEHQKIPWLQDKHSTLKTKARPREAPGVTQQQSSLWLAT